ncbi:ABC transporter ATP-binding protein [bacterium]|nr:ABC transporter ATP-binding protein [bacterium]
MKTDTVIKIENLGKCYRIGEREQYLALRDILMNLVKAPLRRLSGQKKRNKPYIWALRGINLEINQGEVLGVIGRNGAGKSTLLKILSRITAPTEGEVLLRGRVSSLLEVGTGFHPELTGRENIYLNGAILGMSRNEIEKKFDEIVDFSGVGDFIDTPLKRYSSGMYVRLAFAVAAHLEPEILLIDEVLAVGDIQFQQKCLGKMQEVANSGRTLVFVSHNMASIQRLCTKCLLLEQGKMRSAGNTREVIREYLQLVSEVVNIPLHQRVDRKGTGQLRITGLQLLDDSGAQLNTVASGANITLKFGYSTGTAPTKDVHIALGFNNRNGERIFNLNTLTTSDPLTLINKEGFVLCTIPRLPLVPDDYFITVFVTIKEVISDWVQDAFKLKVESGDFFGTGKTQYDNEGNFLVLNHWEVV